MRVLTIETSTPSETVAVVGDGSVLAEERREAGRGRADELLAAISSVLERSDTPLTGLGSIAVSIGPGRFTGLRVGLATAKGLALTSGLPVCPVPTLAALARSGGPFDGLVCAMLDARRGEVYGALFHGSGGYGQLLAEAALPPEVLVDRVGTSAAGDPILFVGTGATEYARVIEGALGAKAIFPPGGVPAPVPLAVAAIAEAAPGLKGSALDALEPVYLRGL